MGEIRVSSDVDYYVRYTTISSSGTIITGFVNVDRTFPSIIGRKYSFVVYFKAFPKIPVTFGVSFY